MKTLDQVKKQVEAIISREQYDADNQVALPWHIRLADVAARTHGWNERQRQAYLDAFRCGPRCDPKYSAHDVGMSAAMALA